MKTLTLILVLSALLAGCASVGGYTQHEGPDAAIVKSTSLRQDWATWESYRVIAVDDKFISGPLSSTADTVERIKPGARSLVIGIQFNRGLGTGPYDAQVALTAELKPGTTYQVDGRISGTEISVWLTEDATNERVAGATSNGWQKAGAVPMFLPVFIPH